MHYHLNLDKKSKGVIIKSPITVLLFLEFLLEQSKKRSSSDFDDDDDVVAAPVSSGGFQTMLEQFGADISKAMQVKRKRLETLTKNYMKLSENKLEQQWSVHHSQRQKLTQQYSQQVSALGLL